MWVVGTYYQMKLNIVKKTKPNVTWPTYYLTFPTTYSVGVRACVLLGEQESIISG